MDIQRIQEIGTHGISYDLPPEFPVAQPELDALDLQTNEGANGHADVDALDIGSTCLTAFHTAFLLQSAVVVLDAEADAAQLLALRLLHLQVVGHPVPHVRIFGDRLKHADEAELAKMDVEGDALLKQQLSGLDVEVSVQTDDAIGGQSGQEGPPHLPDTLEVLDGGVPGIEQHAGWLEAPFLGLLQHLSEVIVLGLAIGGLVVDAVVHRDEPLAIGPEQGDEVDALHDLLVLARPVPAHQLDLGAIGLVQGRVIQDEAAGRAVHQGLNILPESAAVGGLAQQQASPAVMSCLGGRAARRLRHRRPLGLRNQPLHVVFSSESGVRHAAL